MNYKCENFYYRQQGGSRSELRVESESLWYILIKAAPGQKLLETTSLAIHTYTATLRRRKKSKKWMTHTHTKVWLLQIRSTAPLLFSYFFSLRPNLTCVRNFERLCRVVGKVFFSGNWMIFGRFEVAIKDED